MRRITIAAATLAAAVLLAPAAAEAHVTLNPRTATANSFGRLDVRVPNERDETSTRSIVVRFPQGIYSVSYKRVWGWRATITMRRLATPVQSEDGPITEEVSKVTWRATSRSNFIAPHSFEEFGLSFRIPNTPGRPMVFPSTQVYSDGEIVRWNGPASADTPAPVVNVVAPAS
jgi:uncharacterized protein YcnI